jgi:hypothetical protein
VVIGRLRPDVQAKPGGPAGRDQAAARPAPSGRSALPGTGKIGQERRLAGTATPFPGRAAKNVR